MVYCLRRSCWRIFWSTLQRTTLPLKGTSMPKFNSGATIFLDVKVLLNTCTCMYSLMHAYQTTGIHLHAGNVANMSMHAYNIHTHILIHTHIFSNMRAHQHTHTRACVHIHRTYMQRLHDENCLFLPVSKCRFWAHRTFPYMLNSSREQSQRMGSTCQKHKTRQTVLSSGVFTMICNKCGVIEYFELMCQPESPATPARALFHRSWRPADRRAWDAC